MIWRFNDFRLDAGRRELSRGGAPVALEPQVFDLLLYLIRHRDRVVGKDELIESVWGGRFVSDSAIDGRIKTLRRVLGDSGAAQTVILTLTRKGYRFLPEAKNEPPAPEPPGPGPVPPPKAQGQGDDGSSGAGAGMGARTGGGKPLLAVLPFANLSGDPSQDFINDGMADDLITELSRSRSMLVISRNSSFTFKDRSVNGRAAGLELGARYVLEGSARRAGDRLRVNVQLIEAESDTHLWAERFDRPMTDVFAVQDEIVLAVSRAIEPAVDLAEQRRAMRKPIDGLDAWEACQRGLSLFENRNFAAAETAWTRAIDLDPEFARPHAALAYSSISAAVAGLRPFGPTMAEARRASLTAIQLDPNDSLGYGTMSMSQSIGGEHAPSLHWAERAMDLGPASWFSLTASAIARMVHRQFDAAKEVLEVSLRVGPRGRFQRMNRMLRGLIAFAAGDEAHAARDHEILIAGDPHYANSYWVPIAVLAKTGQRAQAAELLRRWLALAPGQNTIFAERGVPWLAAEDGARLLDGMRRAGWNG